MKKLTKDSINTAEIRITNVTLAWVVLVWGGLVTWLFLGGDLI